MPSDKRQIASTVAQENAQVARGEYSEALERRENADRQAEQAAEALVEAWTGHCASLVQLRFDHTGPLQQLAEWTARPEGDNPAQLALSAARMLPCSGTACASLGSKPGVKTCAGSARPWSRARTTGGW